MKLKAGFLFGALLVIFSMALAACGNGGSGNSSASTKHVLHIGAFVGDAYTKTTSPFNGNTASAQPGILGMVYETLFFINVNNDQTTPVLGLSSSWNSDNTQLTVHLRQNVKWSDGSPFSSADVTYTFNTILTEDKGAADTNSIWPYLSSVTAPDANTVLFTFKKADTPIAYYILGQTYIAQQKEWSTITDPVNSNPTPIGTGPFKLTKFTPSLQVYTRNTNSWDNSANKIDELDYPAVKDNQTLQLELMSGQIDWGAFGPTGSLQSTYVSKDPTHNHYWMDLNNLVVLYFNNSSYPLNDSNLHQAVSAALNRGQMATQAENGYETPANLAGLPPTNSKYLESKYANVATTPNPSQVTQYLQQGGYTKGSNGFYDDKNGNEVSFKMCVPADWSDWVAIANIIKQDLQAVGINGQINAISDDAYFNDRTAGSCQAMIGGMFAGPTPYYQFNTHLNSANNAPKGWNWGHYNNPQMDALLKQYAASSDPTQQMQLLYQMEDIFAHDLPMVPLVNAASWFEYSTKSYTGWPDASNPYAIGSAYQAPDCEQVLLHLKPVNS
jgi:peptide/nickel transport system substrate-binding protein